MLSHTPSASSVYAIGNKGLWFLVFYDAFLYTESNSENLLLSHTIIARREPGSTSVLDQETGSKIFEGTVQEFAKAMGYALKPAPKKSVPENIRNLLGLSDGSVPMVAPPVPEPLQVAPKAPNPDLLRLQRRARLDAFVESVKGSMSFKGDAVILTLPDSKGKMGQVSLSLSGEVKPHLEKDAGITMTSRAMWLAKTYEAQLKAVINGT